MTVYGIDLFAGAGGLSIGAEKAGIDVCLLLEMDSFSCETLRTNPGYHESATVVEGDICDFQGEELRERARIKPHDTLVVMGGPPCQPFSKAAYWTEDGADARFRKARARGEKVDRPPAPTEPRKDERRNLVGEFWRIVVESGADGFLFENVRSILHPRNRPVLEKLTAVAEQAGYHTRLVEANAADFGVAQKRQRVFLLGARGARPQPPAPTHSEDPGPLFEAKAWETTGEVLAPFSGDEFFEPEEVVEGRWAEHLREIPPGMNYKHHTAWADHPDPTFEAERRFWNFLLKLSPDLPSWTIPASPGPWVGPFHWDSRRLRTPEMAAIQGFPVGYQFNGSRRERVRQIGNAVPPPLARRMIEQVVASLESAEANAA